MAKSSTSFDEDSQPKNRRGKAYKTIVNEVIVQEAMLSVPKDTDTTTKEGREIVEKAITKHVLKIAFDEEHKDSSMMLKSVWDRYCPPVKAQSAPIYFDMPKDSDPWQASQSVLKAISRGEMPVESGTGLMTILAKFVESEITIKRLEAIEAQLNG